MYKLIAFPVVYCCCLLLLLLLLLFIVVVSALFNTLYCICRTVLNVYVDSCVYVNMYPVSTQGVSDCMTDVHCYYDYFIMCDVSRSPVWNLGAVI